jgi:putative ABC transport system permease protein
MHEPPDWRSIMSNPTRTITWTRLMDAAWEDLRLAARMMRVSPGFTGLLLRPLPVADPLRLVTISSDFALARGYPSGFGWTFAMWEALQPHTSDFGGAIAWVPARFDLASHGERQPVDGVFASGDYFATLGVAAMRGRVFTAADDRPGGGADGPVAVISFRLWQRRFSGSEGVIGAPLTVDGTIVTT